VTRIQSTGQAQSRSRSRARPGWNQDDTTQLTTDGGVVSLQFQPQSQLLFPSGYHAGLSHSQCDMSLISPMLLSRDSQSEPATEFNQFARGRRSDQYEWVEVDTGADFDTDIDADNHSISVPVSTQSDQAVKTGTDTNLGVRSNNISKYIDTSQMHNLRDRLVCDHQNRYDSARSCNHAQMFGSIAAMITTTFTETTRVIT
jgi:hypothetical protein